MSIKTIDALDRAMGALHNSQEWMSNRADWTDGRPDEEHLSFYAAIEAALDEDIAAARAEGVAAERARVVADLRACLRFWLDSEPEGKLLGSLIGRYERGDASELASRILEGEQ